MSAFEIGALMVLGTVCLSVLIFITSAGIGHIVKAKRGER